jgi:uncharacterized protein YjbI with pentapeptide repeats
MSHVCAPCLKFVFSRGRKPFVQVKSATVVLDGADLSYAVLDSANLIGAHLIEADLTGAYLVEADMKGIDLMGANLSRTNLSEADLDGANLLGDTGITIEELEAKTLSLEGATMPNGSIHA